MEENKNYRVYRDGNDLEYGRILKIKHTVVCYHSDVSSLILKGKEALETMRRDSMDSENKAFIDVVNAAKRWEQQAANTQSIDQALEYLKIPEVSHTGNQWKQSSYNTGEDISNRVYKMNCHIREDTKYNHKTKKTEPVAWYAAWSVYLNSPIRGHDVNIAGQERKRYTNKADAVKYLEGRKKAYSHLFVEITPPIPELYESHFMVSNALLPGYIVEGQQPVKTEHIAAEVSDSGISMPEKGKKQSVLKKLSANKNQEMAESTAGQINKKKEDIHR